MRYFFFFCAVNFNQPPSTQGGHGFMILVEHCFSAAKKKNICCIKKKKKLCTKPPHNKTLALRVCGVHKPKAWWPLTFFFFFSVFLPPLRSCCPVFLSLSLSFGSSSLCSKRKKKNTHTSSLSLHTFFTRSVSHSLCRTLHIHRTEDPLSTPHPIAHLLINGHEYRPAQRNRGHLCGLLVLRCRGGQADLCEANRESSAL